MWKKLLAEVRGNAVWDAIKWAWCAGGSMVTTVFQFVCLYTKGHPDLMLLLIGVLPVAIFTTGAIVVSLIQKKRPTQSTAPIPVAPSESNTNTSATNSVSNATLQAIRIPSKSSANARAIRYETNGGGEQYIDIKCSPRKLLFEPGGVVNETDLQKTIVIGNKSLVVRRFTKDGMVVDDSGNKLELSFYVLESGPLPDPIVEVLKDAPQLLIEYKEINNREILEFSNDGGSTAYRINVNPLVIEEDLPFHLNHAVPELQSKHKHECEMSISRIESGNHSHYEPLSEFIRAANQKARTTVVVDYENANAEGFSRSFQLTRFADGRVIWQPGSITLRES